MFRLAGHTHPTKLRYYTTLTDETYKQVKECKNELFEKSKNNQNSINLNTLGNTFLVQAEKSSESDQSWESSSDNNDD